MAFKKLDGHNVLFRALALSAAQMALVGEIIKHYDGQTKLSRKQLRDAHGVLRGKKAAPYFISKNVACKVKGEHGMYELKNLKMSADAAKQSIAEVAAEVDAPKPKRNKGKKESKGKRKGATPVEAAPAEAAPAITEG